MKKLKNMKGKKGFTLIELLAVIVVLAIVAVLGAGLVLPALASARKNAFIVEANNAIDAASRAVSYYQIGTLTKDKIESAATGDDKATYTYSATGPDVFCFTLKSLVNLGVYDKKDLDGYSGTIKVSIPKTSNTAFTYTTSMKNKDFAIPNADGSIEDSEVYQIAGNNDSTQTSVTAKCS